MRYLTHYEEFPIYEPAEGGYYYAGNDVSEYTKLSKRQAKKQLMKLWEELDEENLRLYGAKLEDIKRDAWGDFVDDYGRSIYPWILARTSQNVPFIIRDSEYVGQGESYVIERHLGSGRSGWRPYC